MAGKGRSCVANTKHMFRTRFAPETRRVSEGGPSLGVGQVTVKIETFTGGRTPEENPRADQMRESVCNVCPPDRNTETGTFRDSGPSFPYFALPFPWISLQISVYYVLAFSLPAELLWPWSTRSVGGKATRNETVNGFRDEALTFLPSLFANRRSLDSRTRNFSVAFAPVSDWPVFLASTIHRTCLFVYCIYLLKCGIPEISWRDAIAPF